MVRTMKRDNHKCPGKREPVDGFPGNCRMINFPHRHCKTHQNYCVEHELNYMKNRTCICCDKRDRMLLRNKTSPPATQDLTTNSSDVKRNKRNKIALCASKPTAAPPTNGSAASQTQEQVIEKPRTRSSAR